MSNKRKYNNGNNFSKILAILIITAGSTVIIYMVFNLFMHMTDSEFGMTLSFLPRLMIGFFIIMIGLIIYRSGKLNSIHPRRYQTPFNDEARYYSSEDKLVCPTCRQYNSAKARYCNQCGTKLVNICQYCDHENAYGAEYCSNCGLKTTKQR
ncbi:MAG: zinc ribbon domain-containing protein [Bacilli bacterium]|nr:zinc ribbon domain-containing protein [Bacilli bacterium]MDD4077906.1 zinc ribbon domain-containing protein [Bacilli bacterium]